MADDTVMASLPVRDGLAFSLFCGSNSIWSHEHLRFLTLSLFASVVGSCHLQNQRSGGMHMTFRWAQHRKIIPQWWCRHVINLQLRDKDLTSDNHLIEENERQCIISKCVFFQVPWRCGSIFLAFKWSQNVCVIISWQVWRYVYVSDKSFFGRQR